MGDFIFNVKGLTAQDRAQWEKDNIDKLNDLGYNNLTEPLKELTERIQRNLLLLIPSSVHEWIIFPEGKEEIDTINWMIQGINQNEVSPEERLADHAFYYDREKDEIRIAE